MKNLFTITELSNLTGKTRPTLYKYISYYDLAILNDVPYNFIKLFELIDKDGTSKEDVIKFCEKNFMKVDEDENVNSFIKYIKEIKDKLDFSKLKTYIEKGIKDGTITATK